MEEIFVQSSIKKIDNYIHILDPLGLGGADGEYSSAVFDICRVAIKKMES